MMNGLPHSTGEELTKTRAELAADGIEVGVFSSIANVTYVSGMEVPVPVGAGAELTFAPWLAIVAARGDGAVMLVPKGTAPAVAERCPGFSAIEFDGFDSFNPTDPRASYTAGLQRALREVGAANAPGAIGIETRSLPFAAAAVIKEAFGNVRLLEAEDAIKRARWIKTAREIALLRHASQLADVAHTTLAQLCETAGRTEYAMFAEISARVFAAAGRDIPLTGELVTGPRTTTVEYPNGPRARTTLDGDAALMDLSGRCHGYWFDCTNTHVIGDVEPTATQKRFARASQDACDAAMAALKPGALARDAAAAAEAAFARHGLPMAHYAGHQIGVTVNELPRLVPYDTSPIQAGMVFSVEPGAYEGPGGSFGARSEKMVLVTDSGPEILSTFAWGTR